MRITTNLTPVPTIFMRRTLWVGNTVAMGMVLLVVLLSLVATQQTRSKSRARDLIHHLVDARYPEADQAQITPHSLPSPTIAITFAPAQPMLSDIITISLSGLWYNSCVPLHQTHHVSADLISIAANAEPLGAVCGQALTAWAFPVVVGPLSTGAYRVELTITYNGGTKELQHTTRLTVMPTPVAGVADRTGGTLTQYYAGQRTVLYIPAGALATPTFFTLSYALPPPTPVSLFPMDRFFIITSTQTTFTTPLTIVVTYSETVRGAIIPGTERLYRWQAGQWVRDAITITANLTDSLTAQITRLSLYGILGASNRLYLPLAMQ